MENSKTGIGPSTGHQLRLFAVILERHPRRWLLTPRDLAFASFAGNSILEARAYINLLLPFSEQFHSLAQIKVVMVISFAVLFKVQQNQPVSLCLLL